MTSMIFSARRAIALKCVITAAVTALSSITAPAAEFPRFEAVTLDPAIGNVCYAVTTADVNGDGKLDIVAVSENRVQWYENPSWAKHVILENQTERDNVCIAAHDIDRDGQIDFALGAGWTKIGTLQWIRRPESGTGLWQVHFIGQETSLHRISFADVLGRGEPQLVISPLNRTSGEGVRLMAFEIPTEPTKTRWPSTVINHRLNRVHAHTHVDWDSSPPIDTLAAAAEGVFVIKRRGEEFTEAQIASGASSGQPTEAGAGEVKVGRLADGRRFLATIEPMHGTQAVVYLPPAGEGQLWQRHVIDQTLKQGHAVWTADLDGAAGDEIVIGHREPGPGPIAGPGLYVFQSRDAAGTEWTKHVIDNGGIAVEDALATDLNGDGRPDLVAGGRATHNLKLYWNRQP